MDNPYNIIPPKVTRNEAYRKSMAESPITPRESTPLGLPLHLRGPKTLTTSPLPEWLSSFDPDDQQRVVTKLERFPRTKEHLELEELVFNTIFEHVLELLTEGKSVIEFLENDPRCISIGRFYRWVKKDPARWSLYEEAQEIGTEPTLERMDRIAAGTDSLEDIERSKLRLAQYKFKVQAHNKRRYGDTKQIEMSVTTINPRELMERRDEQLRTLEGEFRVIDNG